MAKEFPVSTAKTMVRLTIMIVVAWLGWLSGFFYDTTDGATVVPLIILTIIGVVIVFSMMMVILND